MDAWKQAGLPVGIPQAREARRTSTSRCRPARRPIIVDVRLPSEWMGLRIGNVLNIPLNKLFTDGKRLSKDMPVLTVCNSAYRSSMGASVLLKHGLQERPQHGRRQRGVDRRRPADPERRRRADTARPPRPRVPSGSRTASPPRSSSAC